MYHSPSGDYQHSEAEQHHSQPHPHHTHHHHHHVGHHPHHQQNHIQNKYSDGVNGSDTLTDFVTFVCQEADNTQQNSQVSVSLRGLHYHLLHCISIVFCSINV